jgi:hypothetical protein
MGNFSFRQLSLTLAASPFLLLALHFPVFASENTVYQSLESEFNKFQTLSSDCDRKFNDLRQLVLARDFRNASLAAEELTPKLNEAGKQWLKLENLYHSFRLAGFKFRNFEPPPQSDPEFLNYLEIKLDSGSFPRGLLVRTWRGLEAGIKTIDPPVSLKSVGNIKGLRVSPLDSILIMTINGGLINGRLEGADGEKIVIREIPTNSRNKRQLRDSGFRTLDLSEVARIEVIANPRLNPTHSAINNAGDYWQTYMRRKPNIIRIDIQPDDFELLNLVHEGRAGDVKQVTLISIVDLRNERHPAYSTPFFLDCDILLLSRVVSLRSGGAN